MAAVAAKPDRVEVIATGLVVLDHTGRAAKDNRLRYDGAVFAPGQRLTVPRADAVRFARQQQAQIVDELPAVDFWAPDRLLMVEPGHGQPLASGPSLGALKIVSGCGYDPGAAAYRLHSALTECTPHGTAFVRFLTRRNNPFHCPTQINATKQPAVARALLLEADVVHCHIDPLLTQNAGLARRPRKGQIVIRHYHGTKFNGRGEQERDADQWPVLSATQDDLIGYVLVGARLTVCALRPGRIHWLPITVPCDRYAVMARAERAPREGRPFRVAHSPTRTLIKGTRELRAAVTRLQRRGVAIEVVMIQRKSHADALRLRAGCDATFDAFALGIQGSGLEAAAMGQPVVAGDATVRALHEQHIGYCPYTYAADGAALEAHLERLVMDQDYYDTEQRRVTAYCRQYHDYPAVAARYEQILREARV